MECTYSKDQEIKKMAIDVCYTMAVILPETLAPYRDHFIESLGESRYDRIKPVREASIEALAAFK